MAGFKSGKQIAEMIDQGIISIKPFPRIGPVSFDITLDRVFRTPRTCEIIMNEKETLTEFLDRCEEIIQDEMIIGNGQTHIGLSKERVRLPYGLARMVHPRSSIARYFLYINTETEFLYGNFEGYIPLHINSFGSDNILRKGRQYSQVFIYDGAPLHYSQIGDIIEKGEISLKDLDGRPAETYLDMRNSSIMLHLHPEIKILTGKGYFDADSPSNSKFTNIDLTNFPDGLVIPAETCFLASTLERVRLSERYIGELDMIYRRYGKNSPWERMILHPNCPIHNPDSDISLVLECRTDLDVLCKANMPIVGLKIWPMDQPASYKGRYCNQRGTVESKAHLGL